MMKNLGHMLPHLNYWEKKMKKFDDWQKTVIQYVNKKKSVIVRAPTSSGKTFIVCQLELFIKRLFIYALQNQWHIEVGANFINMGYKVHFYWIIYPIILIQTKQIYLLGHRWKLKII